MANDRTSLILMRCFSVVSYVPPNFHPFGWSVVFLLESLNNPLARSDVLVSLSPSFLLISGRNLILPLCVFVLRAGPGPREVGSLLQEALGKGKVIPVLN